MRSRPRLTAARLLTAADASAAMGSPKIYDFWGVRRREERAGAAAAVKIDSDVQERPSILGTARRAGRWFDK